MKIRNNENLIEMINWFKFERNIIELGFLNFDKLKKKRTFSSLLRIQLFLVSQKLVIVF
jgi:hypothetical protein